MSSLPVPLYAGTAITSTVTFTIPPNATITDPSTVTLKYKAGYTGTTTTWVYLGAGSITRVSTGVYSAVLDTTGSQGRWQLEWIGTGACAVADVIEFTVTPQPLV